MSYPDIDKDIAKYKAGHNGEGPKLSIEIIEEVAEELRVDIVNLLLNDDGVWCVTGKAKESDVYMAYAGACAYKHDYIFGVDITAIRFPTREITFIVYPK